MCDHNFVKFRVPSGDSCVPIYHNICTKCRWDDTKECYVPDYIWTEWIEPQILDMKVYKSICPYCDSKNTRVIPVFKEYCDNCKNEWHRIT